ncbi:Pdx1 protein [Starmerella bacillaris]|uniref:Pdx1 protein n=1 Tax=Starmerella bacillaris TaxID=1247836 RepID=A0AAV5RLB8_STABA|nr:Pdx1 protein [Starmerella bacillaris]
MASTSIRVPRMLTPRLTSLMPWSTIRKFSGSSIFHAYQIFNMPAMSPTMEEGGIVEWKVKPGNSFTVGDVLLEIETDKAEISVEAQDDGILAKILQDNGAKGVAVGTPIAVTADSGDSIVESEIDELLKANSASHAEAKAETVSTPAENKDVVADSSSPIKVTESKAPHNPHRKTILPSALRLLKINNINHQTIQGSGPLGRITKGDVLAKLGLISHNHVAGEQERVSKLSKLDLSNIQAAAPKPSASVNDTPSDTPKAAAKNSEQPVVPKFVLTHYSIPLTADSSKIIEKAKKVAMRTALLSAKPRPSILRDDSFDFLTSSRTPPFTVKSSKILVRRARPISLEITIEEPFSKTQGKQVDVYLKTLETQLMEVK